MWCYRHNVEYNSLTCNCCACPHDAVYYNPVQQFNYECPECHGRFNYPAWHCISETITGYFQVCPFCNRKMEGLN